MLQLSKRVLGRLSSRRRTPPGASNRGFILIAVMLMLVALMAASLVVARHSTINATEVRRDYQEEQAFWAADGGAVYAESWLHELLAANASPSQADLDVLEPPDIPRHRFGEYRITKLPLEPDVLIVRGPLAGMRRDVQPYEIRSYATNDNGSIGRLVVLRVDQVATVLYQYAMYWDGDLELWPLGSNPSVYEGHIHSNGDIYLGAGRANFDIYGSVTAAGHIYCTPKDSTLPDNGSVRIGDLARQLHQLNYDWRDSNWVDRSLDDWDGLVQDSSHGIHAAPYPIQTLPDPIQLIKRGDPLSDDSLERRLRFRYRAGLKILDGFGTDSLGNAVALNGVMSDHSVMDWREGHPMTMRQIDLDSLRIKGYAPANGVIYISDDPSLRSHPAVRLVHGQRLPAGGLIIASDNPVYVWGDFNTISKQPCSIFCDAFNLYSVDWNDALAGSNLNNRNARDTYVNTCIVAGNQETDPGMYGGGASSLIRLHERWPAQYQMTYRGSLVCLWESEQAIGPFVEGSPVFSEHHRNSAFDPELLDPEYWPDHSFWNSQVIRSSWVSY